jgi:ATP-dependent DNA helicase Q1
MRCGHCDNCTRDPESVVERDVTIEAKCVLTVARTLHSTGENVTAAQLAQAARGSGTPNKTFQLTPGDKVTLSPLVRPISGSHTPASAELNGVGTQDTEVLVAHMLLEGYLEKSYASSPYRVQVYIQPGALARRLDQGQKLVIHFLLPDRGSRARHKKDNGKKRKAGHRPRISKDRVAAHMSEDEDPNVIDLSGEDWEEDAPESSSKRRRSDYQPSCAPTRSDDARMDDATNDDSESEDAEWKGNLRGAPAVTHRTLRRSPRKAPLPSGSGVKTICDGEVIEILSE